jgi:uncharacterized OB-fold protein
MADYAKPLPIADPDSQPYWEGAKAHELRAQKCAGCGKLRWPPQGFCPHCSSWRFDWAKLAPTGTVESYVVVHQATHPAFAGDVPYIVVHVVIDGTDGAVSIISNLIDYPWEDVKVGLRVQAVFDDVTDEVTLPKFRAI